MQWLCFKMLTKILLIFLIVHNLNGLNLPQFSTLEDDTDTSETNFFPEFNLPVTDLNSSSNLPKPDFNLASFPFPGGGFNIKDILFDVINGIFDKRNSTCMEDFKKWLNGFDSNETWPWAMLDASAKPQTGLLSGNIMHLGNYDQCLSIAKSNSYINSTITGKYCILTLGNISNYIPWELPSEVNLWIRVSAGICLPNSCTKDDFNYIWSSSFQKILNLFDNFDYNIEPIYLEELCYDSEKANYLNTLDKITISLLCIIIIILILSTLYHIYFMDKTENKRLIAVLSSFSIKQNFYNLLTVDKSKEYENKENYIKCIDGIKVLTVMWMILGHGSTIRYFVPNMNTLDYTQPYNGEFMCLFIISATFAGDTFLTVSGLIVVYAALNKIQNKTYSLCKFYLARFIRLLPSLVAIILISASIYTRFGDGPFWAVIDNYVRKPCEKNWFLTFLFLQNYINSNEQCIPQSWFLAIEMQLYLLSPILIIMFKRYFKKTIIATICIILISAAANFVLTITQEIDSIFIQGLEIFNTAIYYPTHARIGSWLIGAITGYILHKQKKLITSTKNKKFLLLASLGLMFGVIIGHAGFTNYNYDKFRSAFFNAFARNAWSICIAFIIYFFVTQNSCVFNKFLSAKIFHTLCKLNYSMFLTHVLVILLKEGQNRTAGYFSAFAQFHNFCGDYIFSMLAAVILNLTIEQPFWNLIRSLTFFL